MRPRLLDLFCCQGGAAKGYADAGFEVIGVDIDPQPRYPFEFHQADALDFPLEGFDVIHASPPCQAFTRARKLQGNSHPDLIGLTRWRLVMSGLPYIIENVEGAPLIGPVMLCGAMFGLRTYRHRLFESDMPLIAPAHPTHVAPHAKMGRPVRDGEFMHVVGHFSDALLGREIMGMPWATKAGCAEAVPAVYTEFLGRQVMAVLGCPDSLPVGIDPTGRRR
jgi:DNA (cytosine-5)-methyltransferase 1